PPSQKSPPDRAEPEVPSAWIQGAGGHIRSNQKSEAKLFSPCRRLSRPGRRAEKSWWSPSSSSAKPRSSSLLTRTSKSWSVRWRIDTSFLVRSVTTQSVSECDPWKRVRCSKLLHRSGSIHKTQEHRLWFTEPQFVR